MKKSLLASAALMLSTFSFAQIEGKWKTIDDETKQPKSIVEITRNPNGTYTGRIAQLLIKPANDRCVACKDDRKNKPLIGMEVIRGLKKNGNDFTDGTITDPKNGKTYSVTIKPSGNTLNVRAYVMGISLLGRTQIWQKVN